MSYITRPVTDKQSAELACAKCSTFYRQPGDTLCEFCADIREQEAIAFRRGDPEQKVGL